MRAIQILGSALFSLLLFMLPFTGYIQIVSIQYSVYTKLIDNSGLFRSENERTEANKALYEGLMQSKRITFTPQQARLTEDEQKHMLDVSRLLYRNRYVSIISLLLFMILMAGCYVRKQWKWLYLTALSSLVLFLTTLVLGLLNFNALFYLFHRVLFRNDLWLLPADSVLLKIFPNSFFFRHFIGIFSVACGWFIFLMLGASQLAKRSHA